MKLVGRNGISARVRAFYQVETESLVRVRMGGLVFMLDTDEAVDLATQLVAAVDAARATDAAEAVQ